MHKSIVLAVAALCVVAAPGVAARHHGSNMQLSPEIFSNWMAEGGVPLHGHEEIPELRQKLVKRTMSFIEEYMTDPNHYPEVSRWLADAKMTNTLPSLEEIQSTIKSLLDPERQELHELERDQNGDFKTVSPNPYPYFAFIPMPVGNMIPDGPAISWSAPCWASNTATAKTVSPGVVQVTITVDQQQGLFCSDHYWLATVQSIKIGVSTSTRGAHTITWNATAASPAEQYDLAHRGVRLMQAGGDTLTMIGEIIDTALMFLPLTTKGVSPSAAMRNIDFLRKYADINMGNRTVQEVDIDPSTVQDGDFFGIIRLDGLDPMLAWAMGSTTGHTTVALRENGTLFIRESTANDSYWPVNGIQKTEFSTWIAQAKAAGFQVVHAPLTKEVAAKFDAEAALKWYSTVEGLNYGYHNMLFGWIDTLNDNYPCVAPNYTQCLTWDVVEVLFGLIDKIAPTASDLIMNAALNMRLNTTGLRMAEVLQEADKVGIKPNVLPTIVEEDIWMYQTTRYGKPAVGRSMVCCVFVCSTWKAAGVFGADEVNCGEFTNWDDYSMTILDTPPRPANCVAADPDNQLCQLLGAHTLNLNNYTSKAMYPHMAERCPSEAPYYRKPANC